jgi:hypothetical protein
MAIKFNPSSQPVVQTTTDASFDVNFSPTKVFDIDLIYSTLMSRGEQFSTKLITKININDELTRKFLTIVVQKILDRELAQTVDQITDFYIPTNGALHSVFDLVFENEFLILKESEKTALLGGNLTLKFSKTGTPSGAQDPVKSLSISFTDKLEYDLDKIISEVRRDNSNESLIMRVNTEEYLAQQVIDSVIKLLLEKYSVIDIKLIPNFQEIFNQTFQVEFDKLTDEKRKAIIGGSLVLDSDFKSRVVNTDIDNYLLTKAEAFQKVSWTNLTGDTTDESDLEKRSLYVNKIEVINVNKKPLEIINKSVNIDLERLEVRRVLEQDLETVKGIGRLIYTLDTNKLFILLPNNEYKLIISRDSYFTKTETLNILQNYLTAEADPIFTASPSFSITNTQISNWDTAYGWGNHSIQNYARLNAHIIPLTNELYDLGSETFRFRDLYLSGDSLYLGNIRLRSNSDGTLSLTTKIGGVWNDNNTVGILRTSDIGVIVQPKGNYLTIETDPTIGDHIKAITPTNISNWITAYGWGNHAGLYKSISWLPNWNDVSSKPATATRWPSWAEVTDKPSTFPPSTHTITSHGSMTANRLIGRILTNGSPQELTAANVRTILTDSFNRFITDTERIDWNTAYGWGNHAVQSYLKSITKAMVEGVLTGNISTHTHNQYLTSFIETDPTVASHIKAITTTNVSNWNTAFNWGNHALGSYLTTSLASTTYVPLTRTIAGLALSSNITSAQLINALDIGSSLSVATTSSDGLMSSVDKTNLNTLVALLQNSNNNLIDTLAELLEIFENYPQGTDIVQLLSEKQDENDNLTAISGLTGTGFLKKTDTSAWILENDISFGEVTQQELDDHTSIQELRTSYKEAYSQHYKEITKTTVSGTKKVTAVNIWENSTKATKLFTKTISYNASIKAENVVTYDEITGKTLTKIIAYPDPDTVTITEIIT